MEVLLELARARSNFFRRPYMYQNRNTLTPQFIASELAYLTMLTTLTRPATSISFSFPVDFNDAVVVAPSQQQIANEVRPHISSSQQTCSICQDHIVSDGAILQTCQHVYHQACIQTWFSASVRCPICRRDIREDPSNQTSSAATGMNSQSMSQLEEEDNR